MPEADRELPRDAATPHAQYRELIDAVRYKANSISSPNKPDGLLERDPDGNSDALHVGRPAAAAADMGVGV
ncbi:MAG: hypothetical protein ACTHON_13075 [Humibacter sp.]